MSCCTVVHDRLWCAFHMQHLATGVFTGEFVHRTARGSCYHRLRAHAKDSPKLISEMYSSNDRRRVHFTVESQGLKLHESRRSTTQRRREVLGGGPPDNAATVGCEGV
eukprot:468038_1